MSSARTYAKEIRLWLRFLESRDVSWDEARREDIRAFQVWRVYDERKSWKSLACDLEQGVGRTQAFLRLGLSRAVDER